MFKRIVILSAAAALLSPSVFLADAVAESGFDKFKQRVDEVRPRGRLLRKMLGIDEESEDKAKQEAAAKEAAAKEAAAGEAAAREAAARRAGPQPTPARRPSPMQQSSPPQNTRTKNYRQPTPPATSPLPPRSQQSQSSRRTGDKISMGVATLKTAKGLRITRIQSGSPADKAGMKTGDYILELAGLPVDDEDVLTGVSEALNNGDQVEAKISRDGKQELVMIQFGEPPEVPAATETVSPNSADFVAPGPMRSTTPALAPSSQSGGSRDVEVLRQTVREQQRMITELQQKLQQQSQSQRSSQFRGR